MESVTEPIPDPGVDAHYHSESLAEKILTALARKGRSIDHLTAKDLAPVDQLHTGGAKASVALFKRIGFQKGGRTLDAGCGIGGTSRLLAQSQDQQVTGIDLTRAFVETAGFFTRISSMAAAMSTAMSMAAPDAPKRMAA